MRVLSGLSPSRCTSARVDSPSSVYSSSRSGSASKRSASPSQARRHGGGVGVGVAEAQLEDLARRVPGDELARRALGREPAAVHDGQSVTELLGLVHVVGRDDLGDPLLLQPVEPVPQEVARLGVEPGGGLVEDEDLGVRDERPRDGEPTLHPARQRVHLVMGPLGELGELEELLGSFPDDAAGQVEVPAVDHEVVEDGQLEVERVLLGHDADPAPDLRPVVGRVHAEHPQRPVRHRGHARDHPHGGRLAGTVGPQEPVGLAPADLEVDAVDGDEVAEPLGEPAGHHQGLRPVVGRRSGHRGRTGRGHDISTYPPAGGALSRRFSPATSASARVAMSTRDVAVIRAARCRRPSMYTARLMVAATGSATSRGTGSVRSSRPDAAQQGATQLEHGVAGRLDPDPAPTHPQAQPERHGEVALGEVLGFEVGEPEHGLVGEALDGLLLNHLEPHS